MLEKVKVALRIVSNAYDEELNDLISAALLDLGLSGITNIDTNDYLIIRADITFCKFNFDTPDDYDRIKISYDKQKAQLKMATGYTYWSE